MSYLLCQGDSARLLKDRAMDISFVKTSKHCHTTSDGIHNVYKGLKNQTMPCDLC
jgi:hypothetical protein